MKPASASKRHLELSGIMALRKYCIGMVAESHIRALNNYVKHQIPTLLGSASLWVSNTSLRIFEVYVNRVDMAGRGWLR